MRSIPIAFWKEISSGGSSWPLRNFLSLVQLLRQISPKSICVYLQLHDFIGNFCRPTKKESLVICSIWVDVLRLKKIKSCSSRSCSAKSISIKRKKGLKKQCAKSLFVNGWTSVRQSVQSCKAELSATRKLSSLPGSLMC